MGQRAVHRVGIGTELEASFGKPQSGRQRAGQLSGAVAGGADPLVDFLAAGQRLPRPLRLRPVGNESGVVDVAFCRRGRGGDRLRIGGEFGGPLRSPADDLVEVPDEVEELLPVGERVGETHGHQRGREFRPLVDGGHRDLRLGRGPRFADHDRLGCLTGDEAGNRATFVGHERHATGGRPDRCRGIEDRRDEVLRELVSLQRPTCLGIGNWQREVRPDRRGPPVDAVATGAGRLRRMEHDGPAARIARLPRLGGQGRHALLGQRVGEHLLGGRRVRRHSEREHCRPAAGTTQAAFDDQRHAAPVSLSLSAPRSGPPWSGWPVGRVRRLSWSRGPCREPW